MHYDHKGGWSLALLKQILVALLVLAAVPLAAQDRPLPPASAGGVTYLVFLQQRPLGREEVAVVSDADGWTVRGSSQLGPPIDVTTRRAEIRYDANWQTRSLTLEGVTRDTVIDLAGTLGLPAEERTLSRMDLIAADEVFLCGTGARIVAVRSLDGIAIGVRSPGPVTEKLAAAFAERVTQDGVGFLIRE